MNRFPKYIKLLMLFLLSIIFLSVTGCHHHHNRWHDGYTEHVEITDHMTKEGGAGQEEINK